jgi:C3HC zinc finger-like/Rsm1-like
MDSHNATGINGHSSKPGRLSTPSAPRITSQTPTTTPTKRNLSSFAPWDREQLVARLSTFKDILWSQLPEELCELEWALRGWIQRKDHKKGVECSLCHANIIVWNWDELPELPITNKIPEQAEKENGVKGSLASDAPSPVPIPELPDFTQKNPTSETEAIELLLSHYKPLLSIGHNAKCPWRPRSTEPTVLRIPPQQLMLAALKTRLETFHPTLSFLPPPERIVAPKPTPDELSNGLSEYDPRILQAGLTGWTATLIGLNAILTCDTCHRRVALWLFVGRDNDELGIEVKLDLLTEHKKYCPWINGRIQTGDPGWEQMYSQLIPSSGLKRPRESEDESQFKRLRRMFDALKK